MAVCVKSELQPGGGWVAFWRVDGRRRRWFRVDQVFKLRHEAELAAAKIWNDERNARIANDRVKREQQAQRARWAARRREQRS